MSDNVIIGSGLIATSLAHIEFGKAVLILASGVSDSAETRAQEFRREAEIVDSALSQYPSRHVIYCSSCAVGCATSSPYIAHKEAMEQRIMSVAKAYDIFRLPQVVGVVRNKTLVSHFVSQVSAGELVRVQAGAERHLLDVCDFARIAAYIVSRGVMSTLPRNIAPLTSVSPLDILLEIGDILCTSPNYEYVSGGWSQSIDISYLRDLLPPDDILFEEEYWRLVLKRYVPLLAR